MIHLTLDLGQDLVDIIDRLVREDGKFITDDFGRRQAIAKLLYEHDHPSHQGGRQKAGDAKAGKAGRDELAAVRRERDALRKALEKERATRRSDRRRYAKSHQRLESAQAAVARLSDSRAIYRSMALRVEAALRRAQPREDLGDLEGRLRRALRAAGFDLPAAPKPKPSGN
ncbi:MAG: hypothetical protein OXK82_09770 [Deltaproteobacteria bacterium]|nr:hypothetical protein [Deltaproteobacteria bacterium]